MLETSSKIYEKYIFSYGILPMLLVLEYFEGEEIFEECAKIIEAINNINKMFILISDKLPTQITEDVMAGIVKTRKEVFNMSTDPAKLSFSAFVCSVTILNEIMK